MPIVVSCHSCKRVMHAPDEYAGRSARCKCGADLNIPAERNPLAFLQQQEPPSGPPAPVLAPQPPPASLPASKIFEYKVLTQKDKWFSGKFDPERLEEGLNAYARQGWRLSGMATASVPGFGGNRDELIFVLER